MSSQNNFIPTIIDGSSSAGHVVEEDNEELTGENESVMNNDIRLVENELLREDEVGGVTNNEASRSSNIAWISREQQPLGMPGGEVNNNSFMNQMIRLLDEPGQGIIPYSSGAMTPNDQLHQQQQQQLLLQQLARGHNKIDKDMVWNMAIEAMEEIDKLSQMGEPMWIPNNADAKTHQLNEEEYFRAFPFGFGPRPAHLLCEGTRHSTVLPINSISVIDIFLNLTHFRTVFNAIVSKAVTLEVVSTGTETGRYSGTLQMISTEMQMLCHLVPIRQSILARYCRQLGEGKWGIVDVSVDIFRPEPDHLLKYRKRPSGCIIEYLPNGSTKVTWVEHVEVQELGVHPMFKPLVVSGYAFGAKRWLGILERQTDRLVSTLSQSLPYNDMVLTSVFSKRVVTRMSDRMVANYNVGAGAGVGSPWSVVEHGGSNELKFLMLRNVDYPGRPIGLVLSTTVSFWLPAPPMIVFNYIRTPERRHEWDDVITRGGRAEEFSRIVIGRDQTNCISLIRSRIRFSHTSMVILQEGNWDPMGAYLIYASVDMDELDLAMVGSRDSEHVALLPSGFVVFPDRPNDTSSTTTAGGSMVTLSYQLLVDSSPATENLQEHVFTVTKSITNTIDGLIAYFTHWR